MATTTQADSQRSEDTECKARKPSAGAKEAGGLAVVSRGLHWSRDWHVYRRRKYDGRGRHVDLLALEEEARVLGVPGAELDLVPGGAQRVDQAAAVLGDAALDGRDGDDLSIVVSFNGSPRRRRRRRW